VGVVIAEIEIDRVVPPGGAFAARYPAGRLHR
jgi:hypothetical protein